GNSRDIVKAVEAAVTRDMTIVALTGYDGGELAGLLGPQDVEISYRMYKFVMSALSTLVTIYLLLSLILTVAIAWCVNRLIVHPL
ncbi:hypothetical protein MJN51_38185, partial [Salmonella enterica subsp. enterica serovar Kentucky]|nr:hypothetical protein [Salmonella enterica subsp. enterica serovar Kentucky]